MSLEIKVREIPKSEVNEILGKFSEACKFADKLFVPKEKIYVLRPSEFKKIQDAVTAGRVTFTKIIGYPGHWKGGEYSDYADAVNIFTYRTGNSGLTYESTIIHEAVHCLQDYGRLTLDMPDHEAAAFVAQTMYGRNVGRKRPFYPKDRKDDIFKFANEIAARFEKEKSGSGKRFLSRDNNDVQKLLEAIGDNSVYNKQKGQKFKGNGLRRK